MRKLGGWRLQRQAIWAVVVAFCVVLLPLSATGAAPTTHSVALREPSNALRVPALDAKRGKTRIRGFDSHSATVSVGRTVVDSMVVVPRTRRVVLVQASRPGSATFVTQSRGHSSANGSFKAVYAPTKAGTWRFQVVVQRTRTRSAAAAGPRVVKAVDRTAPSAVTGVTVSGITVDAATLTWVNPQDQDLAGVTIRRAVGPNAPTTPVSGTPVTDTGRTSTTFTDTGLADNTEYSYALFAHDGSHNFAHATPITLRTARLAVTGLVATSVLRTTVALAWTNPSDDAFTGAVIRRAVGPTPPASQTDGTAVADVPLPDSTFLDTGLTPDTQYSYAVFAHDAQHVSAAATLTLSTRAPGTDAVLKVNPLLANGPRVTADTVVAFDASDSLPADGTTLVGWSVDYGDGSTDSFTGPFDPADVFNTTHTYTGTGDKTVTLSVRDSDGGTATDTATVHVFAAPKVSINTVGSPTAGVPVTFEVHADDPAGTAITSYEMVVSGDENFLLDGASAPPAPPATLDVPFSSGTYTVVFTFTNDAGGTATSDPLVLVVP